MFSFSLLAVFLQSSAPPANGSPGNAKDFLSLDTLFQASGATTAVFTLTSVLRALFPKLPAKWVAAVLSLLLMFLKIQYEGTMHFTAATILLSIVNAAVIYAAAVGVNNITTAPTTSGSSGALGAPGAPGAPVPVKSYRWWA